MHAVSHSLLNQTTPHVHANQHVTTAANKFQKADRKPCDACMHASTRIIGPAHKSYATGRASIRTAHMVLKRVKLKHACAHKHE